MIFQESGFSFEFPPSWTVVKFDAHRFYKYLSGDGFKGVDFLCLNETGELVFLEVKNYLNQFPDDGIHPTDNFIESPIAFANIYWSKYLDSIHLITLIHKYYLRKWWFRLLLNNLSPRIFNWAIKKDWGFWTLIYLKIQQTELTQHYLLWLELDKAKAIELKLALEKVQNVLSKKIGKKKLVVHLLNRENHGPLKALLIN